MGQTFSTTLAEVPTHIVRWVNGQDVLWISRRFTFGRPQSQGTWHGFITPERSFLSSNIDYNLTSTWHTARAGYKLSHDTQEFWNPHETAATL